MLQRHSYAVALVVALMPAASACAAVVTDGTTGTAGAVSGPAFQIPATLGTQVGGNLFHSFSEFSLNASESATFSGPGSVKHIISRVTGGIPSTIDGLLQSTIGGADLYFINPAGVIFGPGARVDVGGTLWVSTAEQVRLSDGGVFDARTPAASVLTAAPVASFGFSGPQPGGVSFDGAELTAGGDNGIVIVAGPISLHNAALFSASGAIELHAVAGPGDVPVGAAGQLTQGGDISINNSVIQGLADGSTGSGRIVIRGGQLVVQDSDIVSINAGNGSAGAVMLDGTSVALTNSRLYGSNGMIPVDHSASGGSGTGALLAVNATGSLLLDGSVVETYSLGTGTGGSIRLSAPQLQIRGGSAVSTTVGATDYSGVSTGSSGAGGAIEVQSSGAVLLQSSSIFTHTGDAGAGGSIAISAGGLNVVDASITASTGNWLDSAATWDSGPGGTIRLTLSGALSLTDSTVASDTWGSGAGGSVLVQADGAFLQRSRISGSSWPAADFVTGDAGNTGAAGAITLDLGLGNLVMQGGVASQITSSTQGHGDGGIITVRAHSALLSQNAQISSDTGFGPASDGAGGSINLFLTGTLNIDSGAALTTDSAGLGAAGHIRVEAATIQLGDLTQVSSRTLAEGAGGSVTLSARDDLVVAGGSVSSAGSGAGKAGSLQLVAGHDLRIVGDPTMEVSGEVSAAASGSGDAGRIELQAGHALLLDHARVLTATDASAGGDVSLQAVALVRLEGSQVSTSVHGGDGGGGNISVDPVNLLLLDSRLLANAWGGPGGNISLSADWLLLDSHSMLDASSRLGVDGRITLSSPAETGSDLQVPAPHLFDSAARLQDTCNSQGNTFLRRSGEARVFRGIVPRLTPGAVLLGTESSASLPCGAGGDA